MGNSQQLSVRQFQFIRLEQDFKNIEDIMHFCGCADVEEEMMYFRGGDIFECNGITVGDSGTGAQPGDYIIRLSHGLEMVQGKTMELLFSNPGLLLSHEDA